MPRAHLTRTRTHTHTEYPPSHTYLHSHTCSHEISVRSSQTCLPSNQIAGHSETRQDRYSSIRGSLLPKIRWQPAVYSGLAMADSVLLVHFNDVTALFSPLHPTCCSAGGRGPCAPVAALKCLIEFCHHALSSPSPHSAFPPPSLQCACLSGECAYARCAPLLAGVQHH